MPSRRAVTWGLAAITGLALLLRVAHFVAIERTAFVEFPRVFANSDMHAFLAWAETILAGDILGRDTYHPYNDWMERIAPLETWHRWWGSPKVFQETPLYPYSVAAILAVTARSLRSVLLLQLLVGALQPLVVFALARRLFDDRAGLVAAALAAVYGPSIFYEGTLLRDWLPPILDPLALVLLLRARDAGRGTAWTLAGAALGVAFLVKESILLFVPVAALWTLWESREARARAVVPAAWLLAGFLVGVSPLVARNALVGAPLLATSNRVAEGFIIGNAADAYPVASFVPRSVGDILRRTDGRLPDVVRETLATYHGDWRAFLAMLLLKARALVDPIEVANNVSIQYGQEISPVLRATPGWSTLLPLGVAGLLLVADRWRRHLPLFLYGVVAVGGLLVTGIVGRYRMPLVPVLAVYAGGGAARALDALRERRVALVAAFVALVVAVAAVQQLVVPIPRLREDPAISIYLAEYTVSAKVYAARDEWDRAVDEARRLRLLVERQQAPEDYRRPAAVLEGDYRARWARRLLEQQRRDEARAQVDEAARLYARDPEASDAHYDVATLYLSLGDLPRARAEFERFLAAEPTGTRADQVRGFLARRSGAP